MTYFVRAMEERWKLSFSATFSYLRSVSDLMDFQKSSGFGDQTLRCFTVTAVSVRRGIGDSVRKKKIDYTRNGDLEQLIASNNWETMEEIGEFFHIIHLHMKVLSKVSERAPPPRLASYHSPPDLLFLFYFIVPHVPDRYPSVT